MKPKAFDYLVIIVYISVIIFSAKYAFASNYKSSEVIIENREQKWVYPVDQDQHLNIEGLLGSTEIVIKDSEVHIVSSPCRNKLCISKGHISHNGEWLACLPNGIFIKINGSHKKSETDALSF